MNCYTEKFAAKLVFVFFFLSSFILSKHSQILFLIIFGAVLFVVLKLDLLFWTISLLCCWTGWFRDLQLVYHPFSHSYQMVRLFASYCTFLYMYICTFLFPLSLCRQGEREEEGKIERVNNNSNNNNSNSNNNNSKNKKLCTRRNLKLFANMSISLYCTLICFITFDFDTGWENLATIYQFINKYTL